MTIPTPTTRELRALMKISQGWDRADAIPGAGAKTLAGLVEKGLIEVKARWVSLTPLGREVLGKVRVR